MTPLSLLAGDRNIEGTSGWLELVRDSKHEWRPFLHSDSGNLSLSDGSVLQTSNHRLQQHLHESGLTNRLVIP